MRPTILCLSLSTLVAACQVEGHDRSEDQDRITLSPVEVDAVLAFLNDPATDLGMLDDELGLESRAAAEIIAHRNGADGIYPSADDHRFDTLEELDAVKFVGNTAMSMLREYVADHPAPSGSLVEGVEFTAQENAAVLWGVNSATLEELDITVALSSRAAESLIENGPFDTMDELAAAPYVGSSTLLQLRAYAQSWSDISALAGTFDGIEFEAHDAADALELANHSTYEQLVAGGMYSTGAHALVEHRPYENLAEVAAVSGVGPSTMQALKSM
jgi:DNA uptake protein ComE-like DNA-binding protein